MRRVTLLILAVSTLGCDVVAPTLLSGPLAETVEPARLLNASVLVLQEQGYTVTAADQAAGLVTTAWRDESSFADQVLLDRSYRTRVSVVIDAISRNLTVQMTKQVKDGDLPWRNHDLSGGDRRRAQNILTLIQARAVAASGQA